MGLGFGLEWYEIETLSAEGAIRQCEKREGDVAFVSPPLIEGCEVRVSQVGNSNSTPLDRVSLTHSPISSKPSFSGPSPNMVADGPQALMAQTRLVLD